jgi:hypothetical protein
MVWLGLLDCIVRQTNEQYSKELMEEDPFSIFCHNVQYLYPLFHCCY